MGQGARTDKALPCIWSLEMLRSVLAVLSGPVVFGLISVPTNWVIVKLFPQHFDEQWNTKNPGMLVVLVSLTILFAGAAGFVGGMIAKENVILHVATMCVLQLGIGVAVQRQYWDSLPLWCQKLAPADTF